jgi:hypothetical protein
MHFCFWINAEHAKSFRIRGTLVFREDGRSEYTRFRKAGAETTSKMFRVDRSSTLIFSLLLVCVSRGRDFNGRDFEFFFLRFFFLPFSILFLVRFLDILHRNAGKQREGS